MSLPSGVIFNMAECSSSGTSKSGRRFTMNGIAETLKAFSERFEVEDHTHINSLPDELLLRIFQYVDLEERVDWVSLVCVRWHRLCRDYTLWRRVSLEYEPGYHAFRKKMLHLAPCLNSLTLHLPYGYDLAFQALELDPVPADVRRLCVAFAPNTVPLMLQALERVLPYVRELELLPAAKLFDEPQAMTFSRESMTVTLGSYLARMSNPKRLLMEHFPPKVVRRFWELVRESRLETLVIRSWGVGLLERWRDCGLAVSPGPQESTLRHLQVLAFPLMPKYGSFALSSTCSALTALVRAQASSLRSVGVFGRFCEPRRDLLEAVAACPNMEESAVCSYNLDLFGLSINDTWDTVHLVMSSPDEHGLVAFASLPYVQNRVSKLTVLYVSNSFWSTLRTWSNLKVLEIKETYRLELPQSLSELVRDLTSLERLSICGAGLFVDGQQHLVGLTPLVAPRLKLLEVRDSCGRACVCDAQEQVLAAFSGMDLKCDFVCNKYVGDLA